MSTAEITDATPAVLASHISNLEEEALLVVEQLDRLLGHVGEARLARRALAGRAGHGRRVALAERRDGTAPLERHVAAREQAQHPDTLIVVTADHGHTSQIVAEDASGSGLPTGYSTNLVTKDGQTLSLTYGTAGYGGPGNPPVSTIPSQQHTGTVVPVWAFGPGAANVLGTNDHTDLFDTLRGEDG